jgi:hypothetical protein
MNYQEEANMEKIPIPIESELIGELFLRRGPKTDISSWIESVLEDYLERTSADDGWNEEYYEYISREISQEEFGDPKDGYRWYPLFLPNGTKIYMLYKQKKSHAVVKHGKIHFEKKTYSPSEFASVVAGNTSRNAWRDLYIKRPEDSEWVLANTLRDRLIK